ncbi:hypothetical protein [Cupriavidus pampae]|uniref:Entry exclusion protein n=1 Tax=Cupriavidus pampae TaxID=659251 RepID=A0ABM8Y034_9BURK|nr:hypothetical protein [Cupriavidus pampae]CAG9185979.1 hypothetical protein LMG32289_06191 [Cupriavidus pampae]
MFSRVIFPLAVALAVGLIGWHNLVSAHTQEWYADNIEAAKEKEAECRRRLKADEQLTKEELAECQRAGAAVFRQGKFVKSLPRTW